MIFLFFSKPLSKWSQHLYKQNIFNHHSSLMHSKILIFYLFLRPLRVALYRILKYTQKSSLFLYITYFPFNFTFFSNLCYFHNFLIRFFLDFLNIQIICFWNIFRFSILHKIYKNTFLNLHKFSITPPIQFSFFLLFTFSIYDKFLYFFLFSFFHLHYYIYIPLFYIQCISNLKFFIIFIIFRILINFL